MSEPLTDAELEFLNGRKFLNWAQPNLLKQAVGEILRLRSEIEQAQNDLVASVKTKVDWLKQLEQANRERNEARAKCAEIKRQWELFEESENCQPIRDAILKDNPGQPLLDRLAALEQGMKRIADLPLGHHDQKRIALAALRGQEVGE